MISWELPYQKIACPHCGSTETQLTLELLGLIRYSCQTCRKSFATHGDKTSAQPHPKSVASTETPGRLYSLHAVAAPQSDNLEFRWSSASTTHWPSCRARSSR